MTENLCRITAKDLYEPLLIVLGQKTEFQAERPVCHKTLMDDVLRAAGIDVVNPPQPLKGKQGLYRKVHYAWRNQREGYCPRKVQPFTTLGQDRGSWGLTEAGVKRARELAKVVDPVNNVIQSLDKASLRLAVEALDVEPDDEASTVAFEPAVVPKPEVRISPRGGNQTAQWIAEKGPKLMSRLRKHITQKMPRSAIMDKVDDHIQTFLTNLIKRDALARYINEGQSIPLSRVCAWCRRSAYSDIRDEGRDPVTRTLHGALTKDEWQSIEETNWTTEVVPNTINQTERLSLGSSFGAGSYDADSVDAMDYLVSERNTEMDFADQQAFERTFGAVSKALSDALQGKPYDKALHQGILTDRFIKQLSYEELAEKYGIPKATANAVASRIRKAVRRAHEQGALSLS